MKTATYTIDQVCELTGIPRRTVRYYVQIGLLESPAGRGRGGNIIKSHIERLRRIKSLQDQGLTLSSIEAQLKTESAPSPADLLEVPASESPGSSSESLRPLPQGQNDAPSPSLPVPNLCRTVRSTYRIAPG
jgi:DNA-binding transcriptional MerR regulator